MEKPTASPAAGAKEKVEKQARQLAYDTRYKVRQAMNKGTKMNPAQVSKAYMAQLAKSSAAPAVKARAKQMLLGEDLVDTKRLATDTIVSALYKVFVEGVEEEVVVEENEYLQQLNEMEDKKYKIRVTDKKTGNTYVRMATRAKISELRANPNISSVEMTGYGEPSKSEKEKGSSTAKAKSGKGLDPVGKEDADPDNDGKPNDPNDKYIMKRRAAIGKAIATRKEDYDWKDGFAELIEKKKEESGEKTITGEGVNNSKLIKVFPDENKGIKEQVKPEEQVKPQQQKPQPQQNQSAINQVLMSKQRVDVAQKDLAMKQKMAAQKGVNLASLSASYEPEGDTLDEKITAKTDMGAAIKDFYASKSPQLAGRTKEERRKAAIAAVLTARRGGKKLGEECECEDEKEPKLKKDENGAEDPRSIPTKVNLVKNKLRAMGLKMSYEPEGEVLDERRKEDKVAGTPRKPRDKAFELVSKSMGTSRVGVQPRGVKKQKGAPTPGPVNPPAQKVAMRRAATQRAQDMYKPRAGESD
jgi:hypothetical protein